jgi:ectoine hydroxylase-related dioxygenase (phytanoyl-CoA dioxygenase family)
VLANPGPLAQVASGTDDPGLFTEDFCRWQRLRGSPRQHTPWHQDQPYYNVDGHGVSAWIPVDPVPDGRLP